MALNKKFPKSPHAILDPSIRWQPTTIDGRAKLPPLVHKLRKEVQQWRDDNYQGASATSQSLLKWWFQEEHPIETEDGIINYFQYYFAQREAVETVIYLYEVAQVKDKCDLIRYDSSGAISTGMFTEDWLRFVIKMATGSGKTKVLSLIIAWSYFHKNYEQDSQLSRNFLLITPNIIVLDRIQADFNNLKIFYNDPVLPDNGFEGQNWQDDFQLNLHLQDDVHANIDVGNIFLTNIHRVYTSDENIATADDDDSMDYFLGDKAVTETNKSKIDLGDIVRDIDELMVLNDEAHHIHDERLAWFKAIEDINNKLIMKGKALSLQIDVTATPKHNNGTIFVQTIADYPLVEAIYQDVVKHPLIPDVASRDNLTEHISAKFTEKYKDYLHLGFLEWQKAYAEHQKLNKKAVLFIMTDDTKNCDEVAEYLQAHYPELKNAVLTIHTKNNGEITEASSDLQELRQAANEVDNLDNPYKAIVSVLMLKEGWDVKNVTTIVGLRAYKSKSNILPEQTLGRGLRRMYFAENANEKVSVVGTNAFMEFVESIKEEGVLLETTAMGGDSEAKVPLIIEVDYTNINKDITALDIEIPVLNAKIYREYDKLEQLDLASFNHKKLPIKEFSAEDKKNIVFKHITSGEITHTTQLDTNITADYRYVIKHFADEIKKQLKLVGGYNIIYNKVKDFISNYLFSQQVSLEDTNTIRNLAELEASKTIIETFKQEINAITISDNSTAEIKNNIKVSDTRTFTMKDQKYIVPKKSVFNKIVGDSHFELQFADFLERCDDIIAYAKNYWAVHFKVDYQDTAGNIRDYYPDFIVKVNNKEIYIVETKGGEYIDDTAKRERLIQWCHDINKLQHNITYTALYVKQEDYTKYSPTNFSQLVRLFGGN